jgi:hypothetical protein
MKELSPALEDIGISARQKGSSTSIAARGSISADGKGSGLPALAGKPLQSLQPDQAQDILSKLRSIRPGMIKRDDQKAAKNALPVLELALIPATYDDCTYWVGRLLAHFPRRDTAKDGIVLSDLGADLTEDGVSHAALISICDELRRESTDEKPFMPPSGEIILRANKRTDSYRRTLAYLLQGPEDVAAKSTRAETRTLPKDDGHDNDPKLKRRRLKANALILEKPFSAWTKWEIRFCSALGKRLESMTAKGTYRATTRRVEPLNETVPF